MQGTEGGAQGGESATGALPPAELEALLLRHPSPGGSAVEALLPADCRARVLDQLDGDWRTAVSPSWRERFEDLRKTADRLQQLDAKAAAQPSGRLPKAEQEWERLTLRLDLQEPGPAARRRRAPFCTPLWTRRHGHHAGRFALGRLCLAEGDPAGIAHLEAVAAAEEDAAPPANQLIYDFLRREGRLDEARARRWQARRSADALDLANRERSTLTDDDVLVAPELEPAQLAAIRAFVAVRDDVRRLYIARKQVRHLR